MSRFPRVRTELCLQVIPFVYPPAMFGFISLLTSGFLLSVPAWAVGFQPMNPEELKMKREPQAPGASAIILMREVHRDDNRYTAT